MKNIYGYALNSVRNGARCYVDLERRSLRINGKYLIRDGEHEDPTGVFCNESEAIPWLERKYAIYKHSVPSEASDRRRRNYFVALKERDLSDDDMIYGERRDYARCDLEVLMLCLIINGALVWNEERMGKWFWQSPTDKDFVILRKWIEPKHNRITND